MDDQQVLIRAESAYLVYDQQGSINRVCLVGRGHRPQSYPLGAYVEKLTVIEKSGSAFAHLAKQRERRIIVAGKNIYLFTPASRSARDFLTIRSATWWAGRFAMVMGWPAQAPYPDQPRSAWQIAL